jgi:hypothetical protein
MITKLCCEMRDDCTNSITYIDVKGFIYCDGCGFKRKQSGIQCRKLTLAEYRMLAIGKQISYKRNKQI